MTTFHIFSALLILGVVLVFLRTIFKSRSVLSSTQSETNLRLLRDQLKELKEDHRVGNLSTEQYETSKTEIEGRVVEEVSREPQSMVLSGRLAKIVSIAVVVLIPISALYLYSLIGSHDGQDIESYLEAQNKPVDHLEFEALEAKVIKHIEENPGDAQAWGMLAKTYQAMQRFDEAANALERAYSLDQNDPAILVDYAEARGLAAGGDLAGEPSKLIDRALELDPNHGKGLALGGTAAFAAGSYQIAIDRWTLLMKSNLGDAQLIETLQSGIAEAKIRLVQEGGRSPSEPVAEEQLPADQSPQILTGLVQISDDLLGSLSAQDVVFIFAKASDGPPMPIAAMRVPVNQLPFSFVLDDSLSLMPSRKLSDFPQFLVGARISRSGNAIRASGDLESTTTLVKSGENIEITIDSTVP